MWHIYLLLCADNSYYTGITTDLDRRLLEHNSSIKGAKYSRIRRPVTLKYSETVATRSEALKREYAIKQLTHQQKAALIESNQTGN
jgi:putative endonuclease